MMLRLLILTLLLVVRVAVSDTDGSGDGFFPNDDEPEKEDSNPGTSFATGIKEEEYTDLEEGSTAIIVIAAVSVVILAIVAIIAIVLFRRHLMRREQGVYSVPVEQDQKGV